MGSDMLITMNWVYCYPTTYRELRRLLHRFGIPIRKLTTFHAYWAELPRFNM